MKQIKTVAVIRWYSGFGGEKNTEKFDNAVNRAIGEINGEVIDIKYSFDGNHGIATAMIIWEKR